MVVAVLFRWRLVVICCLIWFGDAQSPGFTYNQGVPGYGQQYNYYAGQQFGAGVPQYQYGFAFGQSPQPQPTYVYPGHQPQQQVLYYNSYPQYVYSQPQFGYYQQPQPQPQQYWQQPHQQQPYQQGQQFPQRPTQFSSEQLRGQPNQAHAGWVPSPPPAPPVHRAQASPPAPPPPPQASPPPPAPKASPAPPPPAKSYRPRRQDSDGDPAPGRMPTNRARQRGNAVEVYCGGLKGGFSRACSECPPQDKRHTPAGKEWCRGDCKWDEVRNTCGDNLLGL